MSLTAAVVLVCGANTSAVRSTRDSVFVGVSAGGEFDVGAVFSECATGDCVISGSATFEVGPSSGSVDVDVVVRYNAVSKNAAAATHTREELQFQIPKLGNMFSTIFPASPHVFSVSAT